MTQTERRKFLIEYLKKERPEERKLPIPEDESAQRYLLRALMNVREPNPASEEFLHIQDEYLKEENKNRGITDIADLKPVVLPASTDRQGSTTEYNSLYLWRGDITTLKVDAIVNAANSGMTGCWQPNHACIDNCIHTFAGVQLRRVCAEIMQKQGHEEPTGKAKITPAFNLPCKYVLHTVGPIIYAELTDRDRSLLASCYKSCLDLACENNCESVAFCCISTGVFRFPPEEAAKIAVKTVCDWKIQHESKMKVVFNVFSQKDEEIYKKLFATNDKQNLNIVRFSAGAGV